MYDQTVFDRSLPDARFNDRNINIDLSWSQKSTMAPLFAATQEQVSHCIFSVYSN
jgi:hypothetical protein